MSIVGSKFTGNFFGFFTSFETIEEMRIFNICADTVEMNSIKPTGSLRDLFNLTKELYKFVKDELSNEIFNNEELSDCEIMDAATSLLEEANLKKLSEAKTYKYKAVITETYQKEVELTSKSNNIDIVYEIVEDEINADNELYDPMSPVYMIDRDIKIELIESEEK